MFAPSVGGCQKHWVSYVAKGTGFKCDFNAPYSQEYEERVKPLNDRLYTLSLSERVLYGKSKPRSTEPLCPYRKSSEELEEINGLKAQLEGLKAKKAKVRQRDKSFEMYRITGTFSNWTKDESIFATSAMIQKRDGDILKTSTSVLILDYPKIEEWKKRRHVIEYGYRLFNPLSDLYFDYLYFVGKERLFNPLVGYFEVPVFSFTMPQSKRKLWPSMIRDLEGLDREIYKAEEQVKRLYGRIRVKCAKWHILETKKVKEKIKSLRPFQVCAKAQDRYLSVIRDTRYEVCASTLKR